MTPRVANAPLSYGAFEMTVGTDFAVPDPERILEAIGAAGYEGTDLGPPGYLGEGDVLARAPGRQPPADRRRLRPHAILRGRAEEDVAGAASTRSTCSTRPARPARAPCSATPAAPSGSPTPAAAARTPALRLDDARWRALVDGVARAADVARERGYEPVFHHHTSTYVEGVPEIERFLEDTDVELLLDSGHLLVAGGDPVQALARLGRAHRRDPHQGRAAGGARSRSRPSAPTR